MFIFDTPKPSVLNSRDFAKWMTFFDLTMDVSDDDSNNVKIWFSKVYMIDLKVVNRLGISNTYTYVCMCDQQNKTMLHKHPAYSRTKFPFNTEKNICCISINVFVTYYIIFLQLRIRPNYMHDI